MDAHVISLANQKGGTAKTTTCANLGIGLAQAGRKVLLVDADAQGSLTLSLGWEPDELPIALYDIMIKAIQNSFEHFLQAGGMSDDRTFQSKAAH